MAFDRKFFWVIKDFPSLQCPSCYSGPVLMDDDSKWHLRAYPKGKSGASLSLYLEVADRESLPSGWRRYAEFRLVIVNQLSESDSEKREGRMSFDTETPSWGWEDMIPLSSLNAREGGFLVNGEVMIIVELTVYEPIDTSKPSSQVKEISDDSEWTDLDYSSSSEEDEDDRAAEVNGFQVYHSQVDRVKEIFDEHPDLTCNFSLNNQRLKSAYGDVLLDLIETLSKSTKELTEEDLNNADSTLSDLTKAGFKLDWLRQKLDQALEKQRACDARNVILRLKGFCRNFFN